MSTILIYKFEDSFDAATSSVRFDEAEPYILILEYEVWGKKNRKKGQLRKFSSNNCMQAYVFPISDKLEWV